MYANKIVRCACFSRALSHYCQLVGGLGREWVSVRACKTHTIDSHSILGNLYSCSSQSRSLRNQALDMLDSSSFNSPDLYHRRIGTRHELGVSDNGERQNTGTGILQELDREQLD